MMGNENFKQKISNVKKGVEVKVGQTIVWCKENPKAAASLATMVITSAIEIGKIVSKKGVVSEQRRLKENFIYDRRAGHYVELTRKLKSSEWLEFDERRDRGENVSEILRSMKVLK